MKATAFETYPMVFIGLAAEHLFTHSKLRSSHHGERKEVDGVKETTKAKACNFDGAAKKLYEIIDKEISRALLQVDEKISWRLIRYSADKTGQADFASERAGGAIVRMENGKPYLQPLKLGPLSVSKSYGPESILQSCKMPGDCWAFRGAAASVVIKLSNDIYITSVHLEHIPKAISPSREISSAPKEFSIWGLENPNDVNGLLLGDYIYQISEKSLQYFPVKVNVTKRFQYIKMKVHSNHGNPEYSCVYRLRVHGKFL